MTVLVPLTLFGWIPVVILLFTILPPRRAVLAAFIGAWLFLPVAGYMLPGFPNYTKTTATSFGVLLGVMLMDGGRLATLRPVLTDLLAAGWCFVPVMSSLTNGLGLYDGLSASFEHVMVWGVPYLIGRAYFTDLASLRELAIAMFIGGMLYVPLCLIEVRMSPQLHMWVYGFHAHDFIHNRRLGGWRPTVFMHTGLGLGMWMTAASLMGVWLWWNRSLVRIRGVPVWMLLAPLLVTTVLCKSLGALLLLAGGLGVLYVSRLLRTRLFLLAVLCIPLAYIGVRATGSWDGAEMLEAAQEVAGPDRARSLGVRLRNEDILVEHALKRPVFGWGGWGRNRPEGVRTITDGMWVIAIGQRGIVGLGLLLGMMLMPVVVVLRRLRPRTWRDPATAAPLALGMLLMLHMIDSLLNAQPNPVFILAAGGLAGLAPVSVRAAGRQAHRIQGLGGAGRIGHISGRQHGYQAN